MNRSVFRWIAVVSVMSVGVSFGAAWAQSANPAQTPAQQNPNQVRRVDVTTLTPQQQLRVASRLVEEMSAKRRRVAQLLDTAQQQHDIIRVNCLNDKLTQIDVTIRSARDHMDLLQTAATISNDGQRNHEYSLMQIFGQRAESLDVEARQCVGEELVSGLFKFEDVGSDRVDREGFGRLRSRLIAGAVHCGDEPEVVVVRESLGPGE